MYSVYGTPKARPLRVVWALEELGQPYEVHPFAPQSDGIRKVNPSGKVPALGVEDRIITDSVAIVQFLADRHGALTFPAGSLKRAEQDSLLMFCLDEIECPLWTAAKNRFILPEDVRVPEISKVSKFEFARAMRTLETRLGDRTYVMGETFTVPDIIIGHCFRWAGNAKFNIPEGPISAYFERVSARPALAAALRQAEAPQA